MGEASFWWPYIQILPGTDEVNPSFTWSDAELALLDGSPAIKATRSMQAKLRAEYATLLGGAFAAHPDVFVGTDQPGDPAPDDGEPAAGAFCFAHFEWAFTMLFSRAIRLDKLTGGPAVSLRRGRCVHACVCVCACTAANHDLRRTPNLYRHLLPPLQTYLFNFGLRGCACFCCCFFFLLF